MASGRLRAEVDPDLIEHWADLPTGGMTLCGLKIPEGQGYVGIWTTPLAKYGCSTCWRIVYEIRKERWGFYLHKDVGKC